jgi:hypothetical protein
MSYCPDHNSLGLIAYCYFKNFNGPLNNCNDCNDSASLLKRILLLWLLAVSFTSGGQSIRYVSTTGNDNNAGMSWAGNNPGSKGLSETIPIV